jgi:plasmid stability protein
MAQVVIRKIDDDAMARLKARARRKGVSLEQELRTILIETARLDEAGFRGRAAALRRKLTGRRHSDSTRLIREDRDR